MQNFSIVIVCKNEAGVIGDTLESFAGLTDEIIVYDTGSTDETVETVKKFPVRFYRGEWRGFGQTKNRANELATRDWILSLDADEAVDEELKKNLLQLSLDNERVVYELRFKNFFEGKWMRFGGWGNDKHVRLFHRHTVQWNDAEVHEELVIPAGFAVIRLPGYVLHKTVKNVEAYKNKMKQYARMNAEKYFRTGRKSSAAKAWMAAAFSFFKNYILRLGFLDGKKGFDCAKIIAGYTFLKYKTLAERNFPANP